MILEIEMKTFLRILEGVARITEAKLVEQWRRTAASVVPPPAAAKGKPSESPNPVAMSEPADDRRPEFAEHLCASLSGRSVAIGAIGAIGE